MTIFQEAINGTKISAVVANLLLLLGEIHQAEMSMLFQATVETGIPLGRVLVMCPRLTEEELQLGLVAAKLGASAIGVDHANCQL